MELINKVSGEVVGSLYSKYNWEAFRSSKAKDKDFLELNNPKIRSEVVRMVNDIILKMSSGMNPRENRTIVVSVNILGPISLDKAKSLNSIRDKLAGGMTLAIVSPIPVIAKRYAGNIGMALSGTLEAAISPYIQSYIRDKVFPYSSENDVVVVIEAIVSGGIGQQHSVISKVLARSFYDPVRL